jgi:hypothetical protein
LVYTNYGYKNFYQKFREHKLSVGFPREESRQFPACFLISQGRHIPFGHDNKILSGGKQSLVKAKKFSDQAFDSISLYCISCFPGYGNSQSFRPQGIGACYSCEVFGTAPNPLLIYGPESTIFSDPFQFSERLFSHAYRLRDN